MRDDSPAGRLRAAGLGAETAGRVWQHVERELLATQAPVAVVLGGSRGHGLANRYSDIDLVFLTEDTPVSQPVAASFDGMALNVEAVPLPSVARLVQRYTCQGIPLEGLIDTADILVAGVRPVVDLVHGVVVTGDETVAGIRASLPVDAVSALLTQAFAALQGTYHRDAAGAAVSGDWATGAETAAMAVEHCAEAVLSRHGDIYVQRKFLRRRLERLDPGLAREVVAVRAAALGLTEAADPMGELGRVLSLATGLAGHALLGWPRPGPSWPAGSGGPVRSPYHCVGRHADGYLVGGLSDHGVTRAVAEVWLACDGRDVAEVVASLATRWERPSEVVGPYVEAAVDQLARAGLLTTSGSPSP